MEKDFSEPKAKVSYQIEIDFELHDWIQSLAAEYCCHSSTVIRELLVAGQKALRKEEHVPFKGGARDEDRDLNAEQFYQAQKLGIQAALESLLILRDNFLPDIQARDAISEMAKAMIQNHLEPFKNPDTSLPLSPVFEDEDVLV